jgi:hypothetical protein
MNAIDFRDALTTLLFERAKNSANARTATLRAAEVTGAGARVVLVCDQRLILVRIALPSGEAAVAFDETP